MKKILALGDIIWDIYDTGAHIGGAALNFCAHAAKCGAKPYMLSRVGFDPLGDEAIYKMRRLGINTDLTRRADFPTGQCVVSLDEKGIPTFNVLRNVAYDKIKLSDYDVERVKDVAPDALNFGTLIQRDEVSRSALRRLLSECRFSEIICDVNLRRECYDEESVGLCLETATILKVSDEEEPLLQNLGGYEKGNTPRDIAERITAKYKNVKYLLLTLGEKGCFVYSAKDGACYSKTPPKVTVESTVGAGDSFTAAFSVYLMNGAPVTEAVDVATRLSAFVVSRPAAVPDYIMTRDEIIPEE